MIRFQSLFRLFGRGCSLLCPLLFVCVSCVNKDKPAQEYNLTDAAYRSARNSEAKRYAPKVFSVARRYMRKGERALKNRDYSKATEYFRKSRYYSEKAENIARVKSFNQGAGLP